MLINFRLNHDCHITNEFPHILWQLLADHCGCHALCSSININWYKSSKNLTNVEYINASRKRGRESGRAGRQVASCIIISLRRHSKVLAAFYFTCKYLVEVRRWCGIFEEHVYICMSVSLRGMGYLHLHHFTLKYFFTCFSLTYCVF